MDCGWAGAARDEGGTGTRVGTEGLYPKAVLPLQAGWKPAPLMSCTSLMEIISRIKLVSQSLLGMAVQRGRLYWWDISPQLHRSHPGCWKLCRLPQLTYGPPCGEGAQERPISPPWICCLKPAESSTACWGCAQLPQFLTGSSRFYGMVASRMEKSPFQVMRISCCCCYLFQFW